MPVTGRSVLVGELAARLGSDGFAICREVVTPTARVKLAGALPSVPRGGVRNLLSLCAEARELSESTGVRAIAEEVLGLGAFVARAILFDKTAEANWSVPYHQDATIAVRHRAEVDGFGPWSIKDGIHHVQPPRPVLERMVTVRIHIDPCAESNGPLTVLPGSHSDGLLTDAEVARWKSTATPVVCAVDAGDAVVMRPLILHASPRASNPGHRRIVHLEFAIDPLPGGLEWSRA